MIKKVSSFVSNGLLLLILMNSCSDTDGIKKKEKIKKKNDLIFLFISDIRKKGNCLRKDYLNEINYCDRRTNGLCNHSELILTSNDKKYNLNEANNLVKAVPACNFSFINSGILSELVNTNIEEDTIRGNNSYSTVDSCESASIGNSTLLISESDYLYLISPKGRIGIIADKIYNTPDSVLLISIGNINTAKSIKEDSLNCLKEGFPQAEKDLLSDLRTGKRVKSISCSTKAGVGNACP